MINYDNTIPPFSKQDAETFAYEIFNLKTSAQKLPGERDRNFILKGDSGKQYVLKIANAEDNKSVLDFQNKAMEHIQSKSKDYQTYIALRYARCKDQILH